MDLISHIFDLYFAWAGQLAPVYFIGLLRLVLLFGLPVALTSAVFERGNRSEFFQVVSCIVGVLLAASIPLHKLEIRNGVVRGWIIALAVVTLLFLPAALAFLLVPNAGMQRRVRRGLYIVMVALFVAVMAQKGVAP